MKTRGNKGQLEAVLRCCHCNCTVKSKGQLSRHLKQHLITTQKQKRRCEKERGEKLAVKGHAIECEICEQRYLFSSKACIDHALLHEGKVTYRCSMCNFTCSTVRRLSGHKSINHRKSKFMCEICFSAFSSMSAYEIHMLREHEDTYQECRQKDASNPCMFCESIFITFDNLKKHVLDNHVKLVSKKKVTNQHLCEGCGSLLTGSALKQHQCSEKGKKKFSCSYCFRCFKTRYQVKCHEYIHTGEKPLSCPHCSYTCRRPQHLKRHMLLHTGQKTHLCTVCGKVFMFPGSLKNHMYSHATEKSHKCNVCSFSTSDPSALTRHLACHISRLLSCPDCTFACVLESEMEKHKLSHAEDKRLPCNSCELTFTSAKDLQSHMLVHVDKTKPSNYSCQLCAFSCMIQKQYILHMQNHKISRPFMCTFCDYSSNRRVNLKMHMKQQHKVDLPAVVVLECKLCSFSCERDQDYKKHMYIQHGVSKPMECPVCPYSTHRRGLLTVHMQTHKPHGFSCHLCQFKCKRRTLLNKHLRDKHKDSYAVGEETPLQPVQSNLYSCKFCGFHSKHYASLKNHMPKHTGVVLSCTECSYTTCSQRNLDSHKKLHAKDKQFKCTFCDYSSVRKNNFKIHMVKHINEKLFCCKLCHFVSKREQDLAAHMQQHGPEVGPQSKESVETIVMSLSAEKKRIQDGGDTAIHSGTDLDDETDVNHGQKYGHSYGSVNSSSHQQTCNMTHLSVGDPNSRPSSHSPNLTNAPISYLSSSQLPATRSMQSFTSQSARVPLSQSLQTSLTHTIQPAVHHTSSSPLSCTLQSPYIHALQNSSNPTSQTDTNFSLQNPTCNISQLHVNPTSQIPIISPSQPISQTSETSVSNLLALPAVTHSTTTVTFCHSPVSNSSPVTSCANSLSQEEGERCLLVVKDTNYTNHSGSSLYKSPVYPSVLSTQLMNYTNNAGLSSSESANCKKQNTPTAWLSSLPLSTYSSVLPVPESNTSSQCMSSDNEATMYKEYTNLTPYVPETKNQFHLNTSVLYVNSFAKKAYSDYSYSQMDNVQFSSESESFTCIPPTNNYNSSSAVFTAAVHTTQTPEVCNRHADRWAAGCSSPSEATASTPDPPNMQLPGKEGQPPYVSSATNHTFQTSSPPSVSDRPLDTAHHIGPPGTNARSDSTIHMYPISSQPSCHQMLPDHCAETAKHSTTASSFYSPELGIHDQTQSTFCDVELFGCHLCNFKCPSHEDLEKHLQANHVASLSLASVSCNSVLGSVYEMQKNNSDIFKTRETGARPYDSGQIHLKQSGKPQVSEKESVIKKYACSVCSLSFNRPSEFKRHMWSSHGVEKAFACNLCSYASKRDDDLKIHMVTHDESLTHSCSLCDYTCKRAATLRKHMRKHVDVRLFSCKQCSFWCNFEPDLKSHVHRTHENPKLFECNVCSFTSEFAVRFKRHMSLQHGVERAFTCTHCEYSTHVWINFRAHKLKHVKQKRFTCIECGSSFKRSSTLRQHMLSHSGTKALSCDECSYRCEHPEKLKNHKQRHSKVRTFVCKICHSAYSHSSSLYKHIAVVHKGGGKRHKCIMCPYTTTTSTLLKRHMIVHGEGKRFQCRVCQFTCNYSAVLENHMLKHDPAVMRTQHSPSSASSSLSTTKTASEKYSLQVVDGDNVMKVLPSGNSLSTIPISNLPEKLTSQEPVTSVSSKNLSNGKITPFTCPICSHSFRRLVELKKHKKRHQRSRSVVRFFCSVCNFNCLRSHELRIHTYLHTGQQPFSCSFCEFSCHKPYSLKYHVMKEHKDETRAAVNSSLCVCPLCDFVCMKQHSLKMHIQKKHSINPAGISKDRESSNKKVDENQPIQGEISSQKEIDARKNPQSASKISKVSSNKNNATTNDIEDKVVSRNMTLRTRKLDLDSNSSEMKRGDSGKISAAHAVKNGHFTCALCNYSTDKKSNVISHMQRHNEKNFLCHMCDYTCRREKELHRHLLTHSENKPYQCDQCDYTCIQAVNLRVHKLKHTGDKPIKCNKCTFTCRQSSTLRDHLLTHSVERPYSCPHCKYTAKRSIALKMHLLTHSNDKPVHCQLCDFTCKHANALRSHMLSHSNDSLVNE